MSELTDQILCEEDRYQLKTYAKMKVSLERGEGCYVFDSEGNRYLDFYGGHAVVSTGHCHPTVVEAIQKQAGQLIFYSNVVYNGVRSRSVRKLLEWAGPPYFQAFLANSGSESNENAIKLARAVTGRREVLSTTGSFHGRNYGSLSGTGIQKYRDYLNTPVPGHRIVDVEQVPAAITEETAAVLVEPIQSMGGIVEIPLPLLQEIRQACDHHGTLLLFDEIQTGAGRVGRFLYSGLGGVYADMVSLAKGIASGFPAGALLVTESIAAHVQDGDLGTTFGGGPLACAALEATLDVFRTEQVPQNAARMGDYLTDQLKQMKGVAEVRGRGLLLGLKFRDRSAKDVLQGLRSHHILTGSSMDPAVLRLMPPLVVGPEEANEFLEALRAVLGEST